MRLGRAILVVMVGAFSSAIALAADEARVDSADVAFSAAKRAFQKLKASPRGMPRSRWLQAAARFQEVARQFEDSPRAPEALFSVGSVYEQSWRRFKLVPDRKSALVFYARVCDEHPDHRLAGEARLAMGRLGPPGLLFRAPPQSPEQAPGLTARRGDAPRGKPRGIPTGNKMISALTTAARTPGEATLSEQMGLHVRRIALDAGHGGKDTGAIGPGGLREKDAALAIVLALRSVLEEQGYEVILTRDDDTLVPLGRRAEIANEAKADLFISVHLNSAPQSYLGGAEVYTLDVASDRYALRLAARENAASEGRVSELGLILADLATRANTADSTKLAEAIDRQVAAAHGGTDKDHGVKHALFRVLVGARCPAVLVETGFISNPEEEKRLRTDEFRERIARAIADGVARFVGDRAELAQAGVE
jgi:N-acetylmuramoyl-L-alanine amidase